MRPGRRCSPGTPCPGAFAVGLCRRRHCRARSPCPAIRPEADSLPQAPQGARNLRTIFMVSEGRPATRRALRGFLPLAVTVGPGIPIPAASAAGRGGGGEATEGGERLVWCGRDSEIQYAVRGIPDDMEPHGLQETLLFRAEIRHAEEQPVSRPTQGDIRDSSLLFLIVGPLR